jgi:hypothetical protein
MKWQDQLKESFNAAKEKAAASIDRIDQQISTSIASTIDAPPPKARQDGAVSENASTTAAASAKSSHNDSSVNVHVPATTLTAAPMLMPTNMESVVEELRQEFFKACQVDDAERAHEVYTMTLEQYVADKQNKAELRERRREQSSHSEVEKLKENLSKEWNMFKSNLTKMESSIQKELRLATHHVNINASNSSDVEEHNYKPAHAVEVSKDVTEDVDTAVSNEIETKTMDGASASPDSPDPTTPSTRKDTPGNGILEQHMHPNQFFPPSYFHAYLVQSSGTGTATNVVQGAVNKLKQQIITSSSSARTTHPQSQSSLSSERGSGTTTAGGVVQRRSSPRAIMMSGEATASGLASSDRALTLSTSSIQPSAATAAAAKARSSASATLSSASSKPKVMPMSIPTTTTTPLHEAARMAYPRLLLRMISQPASSLNNVTVALVDLSQQDWKQRTVLHYLCGGVCSSAEQELTRATLSTSYQYLHAQTRTNVVDSEKEGDAQAVPPSVAQPDSGMKSFYFSTLEKKRQRELEKKRKMRQVVQNFKNKLVVGGDDINAANSSSGTNTNLTLWSKFVEATKQDDQDKDRDGEDVNSPPATTTIQAQHQHQDDSARRLECLSMVIHSSRNDTEQTALSVVSPVGINTVDCRVRTALHYAASLGRVDLVRALVKLSLGNGERGCVDLLVTIVDEEGHTACELASDGISQGMLEALAVFDPEQGVSNAVQDANASANAKNEEEEELALTLPFSWFETWDENKVEQELWARVQSAQTEIGQYLQSVSNEWEEGIQFEPSHAQIITLLEKYEWDVQLLMQKLREADDEAAVAEGLQRSQSEDHDVDGTTTTPITLTSDTEGDQQSALLSPSSPVLNPILFDPDILTLAPCDPKLCSKVLSEEDQDKDEELMCQICYTSPDDPSCEWIQFDETCRHGFCKNCVTEYIQTCYVDPRTRIGKPTIRIPCPHFDCCMLLDQSTLTNLLSADMLRTLTKGDVELFVLSTGDFRFCPQPSCTGIVHAKPPCEMMERYDKHCASFMGAVCTACTTTPEGDDNTTTNTSKNDTDPTPPTMACTYEGMRVPKPLYHTVTSSMPFERTRAHRFCFSCGGPNAHFPASCEYMERWRDTVTTEMKGIVSPESGGGGEGASESNVSDEESKENFEEVAHRLWIKANTRPCPKVRKHIYDVH